MIVYLDVLLAENFIVNLFLLVMTGNVVRLKKNYIRLSLAAGLSAFYSLSYVIPDIYMISKAPYKYLLPILFLFIAYDKQNLWQFLKIYITFLALTFLLAGICLSFQTSAFTLEKGLTMNNISYKPLIIALLVVGIIIDRLIIALKDRVILKEYVFPLTIIHEDKKMDILGFLDTGNELKEPATNLPVIIVEAKAAGRLKDQKKNFYIPYKVIDGGTGFLEGFIPDEIILTKNKKKISIKAVVCITEEELSRDKDYTALLSRGII